MHCLVEYVTKTIIIPLKKHTFFRKSLIMLPSLFLMRFHWLCNFSCYGDTLSGKHTVFQLQRSIGTDVIDIKQNKKNDCNNVTHEFLTGNQK